MLTHNPKLRFNQRVRINDGREAVIADQADHRLSRLMSIDNQVELEKIKIKDIAEIKVGDAWFTCVWSLG
jgi:ribosomal protein L20A (L18A)